MEPEQDTMKLLVNQISWTHRRAEFSITDSKPLFSPGVSAGTHGGTLTVGGLASRSLHPQQCVCLCVCVLLTKAESLAAFFWLFAHVVLDKLVFFDGRLTANQCAKQTTLVLLSLL